MGKNKYLNQPEIWSESPSGDVYTPSYNRPPGTFCPVIISSHHLNEGTNHEVLQVMRWGLIPHFIRDPLGGRVRSIPYSTSNAKLETILQKPTYRLPMQKGRRCVVFMQGFYEWKKIGSKKYPYYVCSNDPQDLLLMAGVFSIYKVKDIPKLYSYSILTTNSVGCIKSIHDRMPLIFNSFSDAIEWLGSRTTEADEAFEFLKRMNANLQDLSLRIYPVTPLMNSTKFDSPECIEELKDTKSEIEQSQSSLSSFFVSTKLAKSCSSKEEHENKQGTFSKGKSEIADQLISRFKAEEGGLQVYPTRSRTSGEDKKPPTSLKHALRSGTFKKESPHKRLKMSPK